MDELLCRVLIYVVLQPRQIEPIETESDQVKQRLDIVQRRGLGVDLELSNRSKHGVAFELGDFSFMLRVYTLRKSKINEVVPAF